MRRFLNFYWSFGCNGLRAQNQVTIVFWPQYFWSDAFADTFLLLWSQHPQPHHAIPFIKKNSLEKEINKGNKKRVERKRTSCWEFFPIEFIERWKLPAFFGFPSLYASSFPQTFMWEHDFCSSALAVSPFSMETK